MTVTEELRAARDLLVKHQQDYDAARREFVWPRFTEFNFATDWFDQLAADPQRGTADALVIVEEDGRVLRRTYAELSASSKKVGAWLQQAGVERGHRLILMLDNQVELWETMLACIRIGAVMVPTTTQMTAVDLQDLSLIHI